MCKSAVFTGAAVTVFISGMTFSLHTLLREEGRTRDSTPLGEVVGKLLITRSEMSGEACVEGSPLQLMHRILGPLSVTVLLL